MRKKRVLIVDDNFAVRSMVRQVFELEPDFEVSGEAENGRDAIQKAENLKPDLVILDLSMPVMSGLDAAPRLKQLLPGVRIILFTVEESNELDRLARAGGINAVVAKSEAASKLVPQAQALLASMDQADGPDALRSAS
jgi:two-component system, NarL family, nitrate/nitrite response regulator NarL